MGADMVQHELGTASACWSRGRPLFDSVDVTYVKEERDLTPRQYQVLALLAEGRTGESIAKELGLSRATAISEIQRVIQILGWHGRFPPIPPNLPPAASAAGIP